MNEQIASRLREERKRLGFSTQALLADRLDVSGGSVHNYEAGKRSPDSEFLAKFAGAGGDVFYILTGKRQAAPLPLEQAIIDVLAERGVSIEDDKVFGGRVITFSSTGMAWLLNYLELQQDDFAPKLSWRFLVALASFEPDPKAWRALRIKAAGLPVDGERTYFGYFFYLDGSPPGQVHLFWPGINRIAEGGTIDYSATRHRPFAISDDQQVLIQLAEAEHAAVLAGDVVVVDPLVSKAPSPPSGGPDGERGRGERAPVANVGGSIGQLVQGDATFNGSVDIAGRKPDDKKNKK